MADPNSPMPVARRDVEELIELTDMISELEAMNDAGELFDNLMSLRDDKQVESEKLSLLNEVIALAEEFIATKERLVDGFEACVQRLAY
ncbi:hypothetical protein Tco_1480578 [Tanacetum coccineum]